MRFASLGSGSRGNGMLVEVGATTVLVDCGFSAIQATKRMARLGKRPEDLDAIVVTHEHADHIGGVSVLARRHKLPVYLTPGTARHPKMAELSELSLFNCHEPFAIGDIAVQPYPVPHDAFEPCQFVFGDGALRLGLLTDVGCWTPHIEAQLSGCDALMLESNHDAVMLAQGSYPPSLKRRVAGEQGHLSNVQSARLLSRLDCSKLQHIVAAHLSEQNNTAELAQEALSHSLNCETAWVAVADQNQGLDWREIV